VVWWQLKSEFYHLVLDQISITSRSSSYVNDIDIALIDLAENRKDLSRIFCLFRLTPLAFSTIRQFRDDMVLRGYIIPAEVSEKHCVAIRDGSEEIDRFEIFSLLLSKIITNSLGYLIPNESKFFYSTAVLGYYNNGHTHS